MMPGPDLYYKCPDCGKIHAKHSLASGYAIHAVYYTDNRRKSPMLPEFPSITKCLQCGLIFWLDSSSKIEAQSDHSFDYADFLTIDGYKEALRQRVCKSENQELDLRVRMLWCWHDAIECGDLKEEDVYNDEAYTKNIDAIQQQIDSNDIAGHLYLAELHRFAGRFEEAVAIFDEHLDNTEYTMIKESHRRCFEQDRRTYKMF